MKIHWDIGGGRRLTLPSSSFVAEALLQEAGFGAPDSEDFFAVGAVLEEGGGEAVGEVGGLGEDGPVGNKEICFPSSHSCIKKFSYCEFPAEKIFRICC